MKSPGEELLEIVDRLFQGVPKNRNQPYMKDLVRASEIVREIEAKQAERNETVRLLNNACSREMTAKNEALADLATARARLEKYEI